MKEQLKGFEYDAQKHGGRDFKTPLKSPSLFGDPKFFKSVFITDDDSEAELEKNKRNQMELFKKKLVVENPQFKVNTIVTESHVMQKY